jgi:hypothetical protein
MPDRLLPKRGCPPIGLYEKDAAGQPASLMAPDRRQTCKSCCGRAKMESRTFFGAVFIIPHTFQCNSNLSVGAPVGVQILSSRIFRVRQRHLSSTPRERTFRPPPTADSPHSPRRSCSRSEAVWAFHQHDGASAARVHGDGGAAPELRGGRRRGDGGECRNEWGRRNR